MPVSTHSRPKAAGTDTKYTAAITPFQHTAARRRLERDHISLRYSKLFQHTAARRRLVPSALLVGHICKFQHTAARRRLDCIMRQMQHFIGVSTHSRPKAAGHFEISHSMLSMFQHTAARRRLGQDSSVCPASLCFNTQPPEGGWQAGRQLCLPLHGFNTQPPEGGWECERLQQQSRRGFNTQPPEGGWLLRVDELCFLAKVSTHSRPKAAGLVSFSSNGYSDVSTHSRPKAAGTIYHVMTGTTPVSTHSRPKAAGKHGRLLFVSSGVSTHSRPKAAGPKWTRPYRASSVSTHSRPKAAGVCFRAFRRAWGRFNTQPPEGGWSLSQKPCSIRFRSPDFAKPPRKA